MNYYLYLYHFIFAKSFCDAFSYLKVNNCNSYEIGKWHPLHFSFAKELLIQTHLK